jgi:hypothetical protein
MERLQQKVLQVSHGDDYIRICCTRDSADAFAFMCTRRHSNLTMTALAGAGDGFQLLTRTEFRQMTEFDYCAADCWIFKNRVAVFLIRSRVAVTVTAEQWRTSLMSCCSSTPASRGCYDRSPERQGHACGIRVLRLRTGNPGIRMASAAAASAASRRPARPRRQPRRKGSRSTGTRTCDAIG